MNKAISWTALSGFAIAQVPGVLARMSNAIYQDSLRSKPIRSFLAMRKQLGLISLWFLSVHIFMSCLMFGPNYYGRFYVDPSDPLSRMTANGESSFMYGAFAAALYGILGICSLPSLADEQMTIAQWQLVYGPVAWAALAFGTVHVICQGAGVAWDKKENWAWGMPPITLMSTVLPMAVCFLKFVQMVLVRVVEARRRRSENDDGGDDDDDDDTPVEEDSLVNDEKCTYSQQDIDAEGGSSSSSSQKEESLQHQSSQWSRPHQSSQSLRFL